jgi:HEAT repeat protein
MPALRDAGRYERASRRVRNRYVHELLDRTLGERTSDNVRKSLLRAGNPAMVGALTAVLEVETNQALRRQVVFALASIDDPAAIPGLRSALSTAHRGSRGYAIDALGQLGAREAVPQLIALLDDPWSRRRAARALVLIRDERALGPLRQASQKARLHRRFLASSVAELEGRLGSR